MSSPTHFARLTAAAALLALSASPAPAQDSQGTGPMTLVEQMAAGRPFLVAARKGAIPLPQEGWSYPEGWDYWVVFEGRYNPESGIWASDGVGFSPRGIEFHACPPDIDRSRFICGGTHSDGHPLSRRVTPRDHVVVILENELTFDDAGAVYRDGQQVGVITVPPI
ncbi:hypothetical protein [Brevundimonas sp.]|uniref:hypothetical protein n=1 Tax=Brevundimonas sp. TaxID=1871086 RepID=UPI0027300873|nr:hypothetical protein [Brevundimonas sp.]MDP1914131.1 hypothetical protein [Brevundimonas sp.]